MSLSRRRFITIAAGSLLTAKAAYSTPLPGARWQGIALGAHADLRLTGLPAQEAEDLLASARAEIERLELIFSLYRPDSALVRLNATGVLEHPAPELLELCSMVSGIHAASGGKFDPSIQPLWAAYADSKGTPDGDVLKIARAATGWTKIEISPERIRLMPGGGLTFNGIAQGFITDKVVALLKARGLETGLISVGEISAVGLSPDGDGWRIGLAEFEDGQPETVVRLSNETVATSSPRGTMIGSGAIGHILDPVSGMPASPNWKRVSVMHRSAAIADGVSTAAVLTEPSLLHGLIASFPGARVNAVTDQGKRILS
jgi:thiamine biosynthesis lipoprotein